MSLTTDARVPPASSTSLTANLPTAPSPTSASLVGDRLTLSGRPSSVGRGAVLVARRLRKRRGQIQAVNGLNLAVRKGEILGLLGRNGAGKSTTVSLLCGALRPDAGDVWVCGQPDPTRASVRARIGLVPQQMALYPELSAWENLDFFAALQGITGVIARERIGWAMELTGLTERRSDRVSTLSGGMQRRLNLACAVLHGPDLLLLDEPTLGADPQSREQIFEALAALRREGVSMVYCSHLMNEAERLCDRITLIDAGQFLDEGTIDELVERHASKQRLAAEPTELTLSRLKLGQLQLPAGVVLVGRTLTASTSDPLRLAAELQMAGIEVHSLELLRPRLEDAFLHLTGRALRDEEPEERQEERRLSGRAL
jgi:ABC-2 type transport system ATP-binding protein